MTHQNVRRLEKVADHRTPEVGGPLPHIVLRFHESRLLPIVGLKRVA
jgi:hypothetical protein